MTSEILVPVQFAFTVAFHYYLPAFEHRAWGGSRDHGGLVAEDRECALSQHGALLDTDLRAHVRDRCGDRIVMEFEFGTNCATYSRFVGDIFGSALAAEGICAFFLESGFLAVLLFCWNRVGPRVHFFSTCWWPLARTSAPFGSWWPIPGCRRRSRPPRRIRSFNVSLEAVRATVHHLPIL
jgi:cytochrome bd ubiquinol oxidase subunit I